MYKQLLPFAIGTLSGILIEKFSYLVLYKSKEKIIEIKEERKKRKNNNEVRKAIVMSEERDAKLLEEEEE